LVSAPPEIAPGVAGSSRLFVEPSGAATFSVEFRLDQTREVKSSELGVYRVFAQSSGWCTEPYGGNILVVEVVAR